MKTISDSPALNAIIQEINEILTRPFDHAVGDDPPPPNKSLCVFEGEGEMIISKSDLEKKSRVPPINPIQG